MFFKLWIALSLLTAAFVWLAVDVNLLFTIPAVASAPFAVYCGLKWAAATSSTKRSDGSPNE